MKKQLDKLIGQVVSVVVPLSKTISLSFRGEMEKGTGGFYHLSGNPALLFNSDDVWKVSKLVIRLQLI